MRIIKGYIKTIKSNGITLLIRETHRSARFHNQPSFLDTIDTALTYSSDHIIVQSDGYDATVSELTSEDEEN